ncbi:hypothetical protein ACFE04_030204 [Oxalis oulophora]
MASLIIGALPITPLNTQSLRLSSSQSKTLVNSLTLELSPLSISPISLSPIPNVYCGRGDKKTEKGKRFKHSFGNARPRNKKKGRGPPRIPAPPATPKKDPFDSGEVVKIEIDDPFIINPHFADDMRFSGLVVDVNLSWQMIVIIIDKFLHEASILDNGFTSCCITHPLKEYNVAYNFGKQVIVQVWPFQTKKP